MRSTAWLMNRPNGCFALNYVFKSEFLEKKITSVEFIVVNMEMSKYTFFFKSETEIVDHIKASPDPISAGPDWIFFFFFFFCGALYI